VTKINGVASKIKAIGEELDKYPELKPFIQDIGGSYKWVYIQSAWCRSDTTFRPK
jgi:hypothetical protein